MFLQILPLIAQHFALAHSVQVKTPLSLNTCVFSKVTLQETRCNAIFILSKVCQTTGIHGQTYMGSSDKVSLFLNRYMILLCICGLRSLYDMYVKCINPDENFMLCIKGYVSSGHIDLIRGF